MTGEKTQARRRYSVAMKALVHDGIGVWLAARRLNSGRFVWPRDGGTLSLARPQRQARVLGQQQRQRH
jgi:transposase